MRHIDKSWENKRLKFLFKKRIGGSWGNEPYEGNSIVCIRAADFDTEKLRHSQVNLTRRSYEEDEINNKSLEPGDLIIEKSGGGDNQPVGRIVLFSLGETSLCSNFLEILRPDKKGLDSQFAAYLLYTIWASRLIVTAIKQTTGIQNLDLEEYLDFKVKIPQLKQQVRISEYLNKETVFVDNLIEGKENLLSILAEKKLSLIYQVVIKGLNSKVKMKDSGIEWVGEVPEHWAIERSKWLFIERNERSETGEEELLTVSHITGVTLRSEKDVNMFEAETTEGYKKCCSGDLVINTLWAWMGAMGVSPTDGIVSPAYHVYTPQKMILPDYIDAIVRLPVFASEVTRYSKGVWSSRLRLYPEGFFEVFFPVPPLEEQIQIINFIKAEITQIAKLKAATEKTISLLRERRSSLIADAVTEKIKIM